MLRYIAGVASALLLVAAGVFLFRSHAAGESPLPAAPQRAAGARSTGGEDALPDTVPEASAATREQKRFGRYDKDRDAAITRDEYLLSRRKGYARLDTNHDGTLSFDEWSAKAVARFATADADRSGSLNAAEFATTALKRKPRPARADCPRAAANARDDD